MPVATEAGQRQIVRPAQVVQMPQFQLNAGEQHLPVRPAVVTARPETAVGVSGRIERPSR